MVKITIEINNITSQIVDFVGDDLSLALKDALSYSVTGAVFSEYAKAGMWDGTKNLYDAKRQVFPTGLLKRAISVIKACGYDFNLVDKREKPIGFPLILKNVKLRDYQEECVRDMVSKTRGLIQAGTGAGKTVIIAGVLANLGVNSLVVVPTTNLLHQTALELSDKLGIEVGEIGDSIKKIGKVTVSTFQSLTTSKDVKKRKYDSQNGRWKTVMDKEVSIREDLVDYLESVECLVIDEAHHTISSSIQKIAYACTSAYYRFGCSATPFNDRDEDVLTEACTGRLLKSFTASYLIGRGWLSKPIIHLIPFKHTRGGVSSYMEVYKEKVTNNIIRNQLLSNIIQTQADLGNSVLVSVRYLEHGKNLYNLLKDKYGKDVVFVNSKVSTKQLNDALQQLSNKEIKICIGTSLINEGVNIPSLNTLVLAGTPKSKIATMQLVGRVLRKTKSKNTVDVYDIQDFNTKFLTSASKERVEIYKTEPEFVLQEDKSYIQQDV